MNKIVDLIDKVRFAIAYDYLQSKCVQFNKQYPQLAVYAYDLIGISINTQGRFEKFELEFLAEQIFPQINSGSADCLDIGANIGNHACSLADSFHHVYAFEPELKSYRLLQINAALKNNISPINVGASSSRAVLKAFQSPVNIGGTKIAAHPTSSLETVKLELPVARIDDVMNDIESAQISFIKLDVEGHEREALEGMKKILRRYSPIVAFEQRKRDYYNEKWRVPDFLKSQGYEYFYHLRPKHQWRIPERVQGVSRRMIQLFEALAFGLPQKRLYMQKLEKTRPQYYSLIIASKAMLECEDT